MTKYLKPGWILGTIAVVLAFAGTATASSLITSGKIKNGTIRARDIHKGTITKSRLAKSVRTALDKQPSSVLGSPGSPGATGPAGPMGATGAKGDTGPAGTSGVSGYEVRTWDYIAGAGHRAGHDGEDAGYTGVGSGAIATVACSSQDKVAISGGWFMRNGADDSALPGSANYSFNSPALANGSAVTASFPGRMDWSKDLPFPNRLDGWIVQFNAKPIGDVTIYAVCVNAR